MRQVPVPGAAPIAVPEKDRASCNFHLFTVADSSRHAGAQTFVPGQEAARDHDERRA